MSLLSNVSKFFEKLIDSKTDSPSSHWCRCNSQYTVRGYRESLGDRRPFRHHTPSLRRPHHIPVVTKSRERRLDRPAFLANGIQGNVNNTDPARLVRIMEARQMPRYLSRRVSSFSKDRTLAFCFDNNSEEPQPYGSGLLQGFPTSPIHFIIYAKAMPEAPKHPKDKDSSYLDEDGL